MKKIFLWGLCFLFIVAVIPFSSGIKGFENSIKTIKTNATADEAENADTTENKDNEALNDKEIEIIVCKVMEHITENTHKETKKAILAVCKSNYIYLKGTGYTDFEADISRYSDSFLEELYALYEEEDYSITLNGDVVPIPLTEQNGGFTATNDEYPYILRVASPWDVFSKSYVREARYAGGISIYGISYLCENGMNWKQALSWYMPNFEING